MSKRNANGQFTGAVKPEEVDDLTLTEEDFRLHPDASRELSAFLATNTGLMLRLVLRGKRRGMVKAVHVKAEEAAAQLAKVQAFEDLCELLTERLPKRKDVPAPAASRKAGNFDPRTHATMPTQ